MAKDKEVKAGSILKEIADRMRESDNYLVERIILYNDKIAAETLIERHYKYIYKIIYLQTMDEELSKDLTQEVFISVLRSLEQYNSSKASFKTWVVKIAQNRIIDYSRSKQSRQNSMTGVLEDMDIEAEDNVEKLAIYRYESNKIQEKLGGYDKEARTIFEMKVKEEYTFEEISRETGMSLSGVKRRYYGLVKKLRKEMRGYDESEVSDEKRDTRTG